jgi:hypothetical protein
MEAAGRSPPATSQKEAFAAETKFYNESISRVCHIFLESHLRTAKKLRTDAHPCVTVSRALYFMDPTARKAIGTWIHLVYPELIIYKGGVRSGMQRSI